MKKIILLSLVSFLVACGADNSPQMTAKNDMGIDKAAMDLSVRPQDDFFNYVNGSWLKTAEIPADKSSWGAFQQLHEISVAQVKELIEVQANTRPNEHVALLYNSFMDEALINEKGLQPLQAELQVIDSIESMDQLMEYFAYADRLGVSVPFGIYINQDAKDVETYAVYLWQSGLGLPDRDYYFDESERGVGIQKAYLEYLQKVQSLLGLDDTKVSSEAIFSLEKQLAEHQWTRVENRDRDKTYNKLSINELKKLSSDLSWDAYLTKGALADQETVIIGQPSYFEALSGIVVKQDLSLWKTYLKIKVASSLAPYLSNDLLQVNFDFYQKTLRGVEEMQPRWKRAVGFVNGSVGELVGQLYVEEFFPAEAKQRMLELVDNLKAAYKESITSLDWMSEDTKQKALEKLSKFTTKIGYPDDWRDYSSLQLSSNELLANVIAVRQFSHDYEVAKLNKPVDRAEWHMNPQTVNAYYNPVMNEIVFPAAILQPPFFNLSADDAVNYGAIGAVIGHEIGHGFDDQGSKYDGDGYLKNWWTDADRARFQELTGQLIEQYNQYEALPGQTINGELTLGENIGDIAGLTIAYKAYKKSLKGQVSPEIEGFTGEQRLFMGWAQVWRGKIRDEALSDRLKTDPHSPAKYRVLGVLPNVNAFYDAFDVQPGDALYLPENQRVVIW